MAGTKVASLFADLELRDSLTSSLRTAGNSLTGFGDKLDSIGGKVSGLGSSMLTLTGPAAGMFGAAIYSAANFETAMANAGAVLGMTADEMAGLNAQVLEMGSQSMAGPQAVAEAYYDIVSGVADASTHMDVLNAAIATSEAGASDLGATTNALVGIMNAYGLSAEDAAIVSDTLTRTVGMGVLTMDELAAAMPNVTALASSMGIPLEDVAGAMALITTTGTSAGEASTQLRAAMTSLLNPNEDLARAFEELGVTSGQALVDQMGLVGAMEALEGTSVSTEEGMAAMLGSTEALAAFLALSGDEAEAFLATFEDGIDGATDAARDIQLESPAAQFALLKSEVTALGIEIGQMLLPEVMKIAKSMKPALGSFKDFVKDNKKTVVLVAGIVGAFAALGAILIPVGAAIGAVGTIMSVIGAVIGALSLPILLVVGALVALGVAYKTNFLGFGDAVRSIFQTVSETVPKIIEFFTGLVDAFSSGGLSGAADFIKTQLIDPLVNGLKTYVESGQLMADATTLGSNIIGAIKEGIGLYADAATWVFENIVSPLATGLEQYVSSGDAIEDAKSLGAGILEAIKLGLGGAVDFLVFVNENVIQPLATAASFYVASGALTEDVKTVGTAILDAIKAGLVFAADWFSVNIGDPIKAFFSAENIATIAAEAEKVGTGIMDAIQLGVEGGINIVEGAIKGAINAIVPDSIGFSVPSITIAGKTFGGGDVSIDLPDPFPGYAMGGFFDGSTPFIAGERGPELVMPNGSGRVFSNTQSRGMMGGGGSIHVEQVIVQNPRNYNEIWRGVKKESNRRVQKVAA